MQLLSVYSIYQLGWGIDAIFQVVYCFTDLFCLEQSVAERGMLKSPTRITYFTLKFFQILLHVF